jgi:hypothetical protein
VRDGQIAIPELKRPFVCDNSKVRYLIDSLHKDYPIGYMITWQNPNARLKDGKLSEGKKILIDDQQRITALDAAILSEYVVNKKYDRVLIKIAFNPMTEALEAQNSRPHNRRTRLATQSASRLQQGLSLRDIPCSPRKRNQAVWGV